MRTLLKSFLFITALLGSSFAAEEGRPLAVGAAIPDATVRTEKDAPLKLKAAITRPTVLIFYRGGWCPYCNRHLSALVEIEGDLLAAGFQLIALSPDLPAKLREKPAQQKLNYTLLSDSAMEAARGFGIAFQVDDELVAKYKNSYKIDLEASSGATHHLLPHPAVFIVDASGIVRFAHVNTDYKTRLEPEKILAAARTLAPAK